MIIFPVSQHCAAARHCSGAHQAQGYNSEDEDSQYRPDAVLHFLDHAHNLGDYCRHVHERTVKDVQMIGIDCDGFDVLADAEVLRFDFDGEVKDAGAARAQLVQLAKASRV
jgi:hypothetical protein